MRDREVQQTASYWVRTVDHFTESRLTDFPALSSYTGIEYALPNKKNLKKKKGGRGEKREKHSTIF